MLHDNLQLKITANEFSTTFRMTDVSGKAVGVSFEVAITLSHEAMGKIVVPMSEAVAYTIDMLASRFDYHV